MQCCRLPDPFPSLYLPSIPEADPWLEYEASQGASASSAHAYTPAACAAPSLIEPDTAVDTLCSAMEDALL